MNTDEMQGTVGVPRGRQLRIDNGRDVLIRVREGEIWLTQERDLRDYVLRAGESMRLDCEGTAVAGALRRSVLSISRH